MTIKNLDDLEQAVKEKIEDAKELQHLASIDKESGWHEFVAQQYEVVGVYQEVLALIASLRESWKEIALTDAEIKLASDCICGNCVEASIVCKHRKLFGKFKLLKGFEGKGL
jgi:hypothetical protein